VTVVRGGGRGLRGGRLAGRGETLAGEHVEERVDAVRVELGAGARDDVVERSLGAPRRAVGTVRDERVPNIGDGGHPGLQWDPLAGQPVGIAAPVPPLVVVAHDRQCSTQRRGLSHDLPPRHRVLLDPDPLLGGERTRLVQDGVGGADLADVVQHRALCQLSQLCRAEPHLLTESDGILRDAGRVSVGVLVLELDRGDERA